MADKIVNIRDLPEYTRDCIYSYWEMRGYLDVRGKAYCINLPGNWVDALIKLDGVNIEQIKIELFPFIIGNEH